MAWRCESMCEKIKYNGIDKDNPKDKPNDKQNVNYNTKDGMQSAIFGPAFWMTIHITSFNYPPQPTEEDKANYENWLRSIGKVLPCRYCRENFEKNMESAGFSSKSLESRDEFSKFCYRLHCEVNKMLGKTSPSFKEVRDTYDFFRAKCLTEEEKKKLSDKNMELGCIRPLYNGKRGKCVISIEPNVDRNSSQTHNIRINEQCLPKN
jgi:hypothetical protein